MDVLFTDTSVLLSEDFVKSFTKKSLESKLEMLRLVCDTRYKHVDNNYALCGKWENIDAAFQLLVHWGEHPDHEPNLTRVRQVKQWCCCEEMMKIFNLKDLDKSESETRKVNVDKILPSDWDMLLTNLITEKEQATNSNIQNKSTTKKIERKRCKETKAITSLRTEKEKADKSAVENRSKKEVHYETELKNKEGDNNRQKVTNSVSKTNDQYIELDDDKFTDRNDNSDSDGKNIENMKNGKRYWSRVKRYDGDIAQQCSECNVTLKSRKRYLEHLRRIHLKEYQCQVCKKGFGYPTDLKRHRCLVTKNKTESCIRKPLKKRVLSCLLCSYTTTATSRLNNHTEKNHSLKYSCYQCDKKFASSTDLENHQYNTHTAKFFFCDQCAKSYTNKHSFEAHLKTHKSDYVKPSYECNVCAKTFTSKSTMTQHIKSEHLGDKIMYLCQICGKKFSQRCSYRQHCNAHNGIKPYKCKQCDKEFVYHKSLKEHEFMHDNIRRFRCTICYKAFRQRTVLHIHMKTHKVEKDYKCPVCRRGFSQKQAMQRHERIHSGVRPYTCQLCKKSFGDTSTIRRHLKALHKKTDNNWRECVVTVAKKKSDHYVLGGGGQNRHHKAIPTVQKDVETDTSLLVVHPFTNNDQALSISDPSTIPGNLVTQTQTSQSHGSLTQIQLNTIYASAIATNQAQATSTDNGAVIPTVHVKNNLPLVLDFSSMTLVKFPQSCINKSDNNETAAQFPLQGDSSNVVQTATLVPLSGLTDSLKQDDISNPTTGDAGISPAIWGFVGYPSACNTDNTTQDPSQ